MLFQDYLMCELNYWTKMKLIPKNNNDYYIDYVIISLTYQLTVYFSIYLNQVILKIQIQLIYLAQNMTVNFIHFLIQLTKFYLQNLLKFTDLMNHNSHNSFNLPNQRQQATGSKRQNDIPFLQLYKKLCNSISQQKIQELQEQLKKINDELFITFQKMENLVKKRQDKIKAQNQKLKQAIISMTGNLETNMNEILMETMEESEQNLENWNLLKQKKANYEKMHQNLLEMKRKTLGFGLFKKASK